MKITPIDAPHHNRVAVYRSADGTHSAIYPLLPDQSPRTSIPSAHGWLRLATIEPVDAADDLTLAAMREADESGELDALIAEDAA